MRSRAAYPIVVTLGAAVASFGFMTLVVVGLAAGGAVAGLPGGLVAAVALTIGWWYALRRAWRRWSRPSPPP